MSFWKFVKKIVDLLTVIITLLNFFFKINAFQELLLKLPFEVPNIFSYKYSYPVFVGVLGLFLVSEVLVTNKNKKQNQKISDKEHEFFHELRDGFFNNKKKMSLSNETDYWELTKDLSEKLCRIIDEYFSLKYNKHFNICLKMIDVTSSRASRSLNEVKVKTFCRAGVDKIKREDLETQDDVFVTDDTSYIQILSNDSMGKRREFVCSNLLVQCAMRKALRDPYKPSFTSFYKKYLSTVVVPIRINSKKLDGKSCFTFDGKYQVVGFLCIDYKFPIRKKLAACVCAELKAFADSMYMIFDNVIRVETEYKNYSVATTAIREDW